MCWSPCAPLHVCGMGPLLGEVGPGLGRNLTALQRWPRGVMEERTAMKGTKCSASVSQSGSSPFKRVRSLGSCLVLRGDTRKEKFVLRVAQGGDLLTPGCFVKPAASPLRQPVGADTHRKGEGVRGIGWEFLGPAAEANCTHQP